MIRSARSTIRVVLPLLFVLACAPLFAADVRAPKPLNIDTVEDFSVYRAAITNQLYGGDFYAEITPEQRNRAITLLTEIDAIIGRSGSIAALPSLPRVDVFNRQEELNQILGSAAEDSRMICRRERPTGSKFPVNNCRTLAQRRADQEESRRLMRDVIPGRGVR